jgi:thioredoxin 1
MRQTTVLHIGLTIALCSICSIALLAIGCSKKHTVENQSAPMQNAPAQVRHPWVKKMGIQNILTAEQFDEEFNAPADELLVFVLGAVWCRPCKILEPVLEKLAHQKGDVASFYHIDVDRLPRVAEAFEVRGIPNVSFVKNRQIIATLTGLRPAEEYMAVIDKYGKAPAQSDTGGLAAAPTDLREQHAR